VQKLIRTLFEKAKKLPAEVDYRSANIVISNDPITSGGFADVYQGKDKDEVPKVALKKMRISADRERAHRVRWWSSWRLSGIALIYIGIICSAFVGKFLSCT
jgi:hypothetical protein